MSIFESSSESSNNHHRTRSLKLLIVDCETTGIRRSEGAEAIEIAAILYSVGKRAVLQSLSFLLPCDANGAEHINGISPELTNFDQPWRTARAMFLEMASVADFAVAHNAAFDSKWFGVGKVPPLHLKWICTMSDIDWGHLPGKSLRDLALANGITVTPEVHRAMPDAQLIASILSSRSDLEELLDKALIAKQTYRAIVTYSDRQLAKDAGFQWHNATRQWRRKLTPAQAEDLKNNGLPLALVP